MTYFVILQRAFKNLYNYDLDMVKQPVFNDHEIGLYHVIDDICKDMQAKGMYISSHNCLKTQNMLAFYDSSCLSKNPCAFYHGLFLT